MRQVALVLVLVLTLLAASGLRSLGAEPSEIKWHPGHYVMLNRSILRVAQDKSVEQQFDRFIALLPAEIVGLQGGAFWRNLEPQEGVYDFSVIEKQLKLCQKHGKRFFCTICERHFNAQEKPVPDYLYNDPKFGGGVAKFHEGKSKTSGSIARFWDPVVLDRYTRLIAELGKRFDREPYFEGIEFIETAMIGGPAVPDLTLDTLMPALRARLIAARKAFPHCVVIQETNWLINGVGDWASQKKAMADLFQFCYENGMGVGGPDLIPDSQRDPARPRILSYEYFPKYAGKMPLGCDVQKPQYMGRVGALKLGNFTPEGIRQMGLDTLKLNYFFWSTQDESGLRFTLSGDVLPMLKREGAKVNAELPENLAR